LNELARLAWGAEAGFGRPEDALIDFELALRRKPALVAAHLGRGNALAVMSRFEAALASYQRALELHPRLPEAEFAAGFALSRLGRLKEAETRYRRALVERPDFAAAWMNLGSLLREQGREAYAEAALTRAVELRPDLVSGWINLAMLERERGRPADAEAHLRRALALNPDQVETHIAWCQFRAGEHDLAGPGDGCAGRWRAIPTSRKPRICREFCCIRKGGLLRRSRPLNGRRRWAIALPAPTAATRCWTWAAWRRRWGPRKGGCAGPRSCWRAVQPLR